MAVEVHIDWLGRRLAQLPARTKRRIGWTAEGREERARRRAAPREGRWYDALDPFAGATDSLTALLVTLVVLGALLLLWQLGILAILIALLELAVLVPLLLVAFVARVVLRRPWRVVARGPGGPRAAADVRGYRAARRLRDGWREELAGGTPAAALHVPPSIPGTLRPDLPDPEGFGEVRPDEIAG